MADLRPQFSEEAVGANHPTKVDVINRAYNVEHEEDGTHKNITQGDGRSVTTDKIEARDGDGLLLEDDGGNGIEITDGGIIHMSKQSGFSANVNNNQDIPDTTATIIVFNQEDFDNQNELNTGTGIFTAQKSGDYHISAIVPTNETLNVGDSWRLEVLKNAGTFSRPAVTTYGAIQCYAAISIDLSLAANDTITMKIWHNFGANREILGAESWFSVHKIG